MMGETPTRNLPPEYGPLAAYTIAPEGAVFHPEKGKVTPLTLDHARRAARQRDPFWDSGDKTKSPTLVAESKNGIKVASIYLPQEVVLFDKNYGEWKKRIPNPDRNSKKNLEQKPRPTWFEPEDIPLYGNVSEHWIRIESPDIGFCLFHGPSVAAIVFASEMPKQ